MAEPFESTELIVLVSFSSIENNRYKPPSKPRAATHNIRRPSCEFGLLPYSDIRPYQSQIQRAEVFQARSKIPRKTSTIGAVNHAMIIGHTQGQHHSRLESL